MSRPAGARLSRALGATGAQLRTVGGEHGRERTVEGQAPRVAPEPFARALAQRLAGGVDPDDRGGQVSRIGGGRDDAVDAVLDQLKGRVVGLAHNDAGRAVHRGLEHDDPIALPARGQHHAARAAHRRLKLARVDEPGSTEISGRSSAAMTASCCGPSPKITPCRPDTWAAASAIAGTTLSAPKPSPTARTTATTNGSTAPASWTPRPVSPPGACSRQPREGFLRVCLSSPSVGATQPTIAPDGKASADTFGCIDSALIEPVPTVGEPPPNGSTGSTGDTGSPPSGGGSTRSTAASRPTTPTLLHFATIAKLPSTERCVRRGVLKITLQNPKYDPLDTVTVRVDGKKLVVIHGSLRLSHGITLRKLRAGITRPLSR